MAFDFGSLKGLFGELKEKGAEYAGAAVDKTRDAARIAKLTVELNGEKEALKKAYAELGRTFYEEQRSSAQGLAAQLCEEVDSVNGRMEALQKEIDALKGALKGENGSFEDVVSADEEEGIEVELTVEPEADEE